MIKARWISSLKELLDLGEAYDCMVSAAGDHGLFYRLDWVRRIWPYYGAHGDELAFLLAERNGEPVGLAPFQLENRGWKYFGLRRLIFFGSSVDGSLMNGTPDFLIADPDDLELCVDAFVKLLKDQSDRWDLLELEPVPEDAPFTELLKERLPGVQIQKHELATPIVDTSNGFGAYKASLSGHFRNRLACQRRKLDQSFEQVTQIMTPDISEEKMTALTGIHRERQIIMRQSGRYWRKSLFDDPLQNRVYRDLLNWAEEQDLTRHYWYEVDGELKNFLLCFHYGSTCFAHLMAMNDAMTPYSLGLLGMFGMIEREAQDHGIKMVNLMPGVNLTKKRLATRVVPLIRIRAVNRHCMLSRLRCGWLESGRRLQEARQNRIASKASSGG